MIAAADLRCNRFVCACCSFKTPHRHNGDGSITAQIDGPLIKVVQVPTSMSPTIVEAHPAESKLAEREVELAKVDEVILHDHALREDESRFLEPPDHDEIVRAAINRRRMRDGER